MKHVLTSIFSHASCSSGSHNRLHLAARAIVPSPNNFCAYSTCFRDTASVSRHALYSFDGTTCRLFTACTLVFRQELLSVHKNCPRPRRFLRSLRRCMRLCRCMRPCRCPRPRFCLRPAARTSTNVLPTSKNFYKRSTCVLVANCASPLRPRHAQRYPPSIILCRARCGRVRQYSMCTTTD